MEVATVTATQTKAEGASHAAEEGATNGTRIAHTLTACCRCRTVSLPIEQHVAARR